MKKLLAFALALSMALGVIACGGEKAPETSESVSSEAETTAEATTAADENAVWLPYDESGNMVMTDRDATGKEAAVSSTSWYASKAGLDVLKEGGNAVDAAIAVAYTLGVVEPFTSGIGGGGFMVIYDNETKQTNTIDFREKAPAAATATMWLDEAGELKYYTDASGKTFAGAYSKLNRLGGMAVAVPGAVAGLEAAYTEYGSGNFTMAQLLEDAIGYAKNGYVVTPTMETSTNDEYVEISGMPDISAYYLDEFGLAPEVGSTITNEDLAKTLELIAEGGSEVFYKGEIADAIVDAVTAVGGVMTKDDFAAYSPVLSSAISSSYKDYKIYTLAPSSSGGTHLLEILNILENFDMASYGVNDTYYLHLIAEATKIAFADREVFMADTAFADVPVEQLISKEYAATRAAEIVDGNGSYDAGVLGVDEHSSTTSFSVMDKDGNMVACTVTIGDFYGSKVAVPGYGIILNDEMYDFDTDPESVNCVEGGKRPLSSMSPAVVLYPDGTPFMTIGTPGATRIFTVIAQVIERMIDYDMDVQEAIETARIYNNTSATLAYEPGCKNPISDETLAKLTEAGYTLSEKKEYDLYFGGVQAIAKLKDGTVRGGADPRRTGKALAY